jgi:membrane protease YdiL (CAAX protease family)
METTAGRPGPGTARADDNPARRPLLVFAAVALPTGWILLGLPVALGLPVEPFVLATLLIGLVVPAVVMTRRDPGASVRALLRDTVRAPHPWLLLLAALGLVPALTWVLAALTGHAPVLDSALLLGALLNVVSSVVIVNLWEEMAWQGFFQRRASSRWGFLGGALVTATMFVGVHLALAFAGAAGAGAVGRGLAALVGSGIGLRLLLGALDRWSGRSIVSVAVAHASFNAAADFVQADADWVRYTVTLVLGLAALSVVLSRGEGGTR